MVCCPARPGLSPSSLCASSGCAGNDEPDLQGFSPHLLVHSCSDKSCDCLSNAKMSGKAKKDLYIQTFHLLWAALRGECSVLLCCALTWVTSCPSPQNIVISEGILHMCSCYCYCYTTASGFTIYTCSSFSKLQRSLTRRYGPPSTLFTVYPGQWHGKRRALGKFLSSG